ncbi:caspase domain-containing protein [Mycena amicta]|nr:caspase domain-containing protein [Mycena amicta]
MEPPIRVFALIVGIDKYESGAVWNLESCADDAQRVRQWLRNDLKVPKDHICMLLDKHATKDNIEKAFVRHLINNESIQRGDAIVVYFAGHGSTVAAPEGWFHLGSVGGTAEVLCSYDFGQRGVVGISDRCLQSMVEELSKMKGDNIAVILDSCFTPVQSPSNVRARSHTRWTPSGKLAPNDLMASLWHGAQKRPYPRGVGFYNAKSTAYTLLAACSPGEKALEGKEGGKFTSAFLEAAHETPLHSASYVSLLQHIVPKIKSQRPFFSGATNRPVFNAVPFRPNETYFQIDAVRDPKMLRIELGAVHGVVAGTKFSVHAHNYSACNPAIAHVSVTDVHPTCSFGYTTRSVPSGSWAQIQIRRWNNQGFFRTRSKRSLHMLLRPPREMLRSFSTTILYRRAAKS